MELIVTGLQLSVFFKLSLPLGISTVLFSLKSVGTCDRIWIAFALRVIVSGANLPRSAILQESGPVAEDFVTFIEARISSIVMGGQEVVQHSLSRYEVYSALGVILL